MNLFFRTFILLSIFLCNTAIAQEKDSIFSKQKIGEVQIVSSRPSIVKSTVPVQLLTIQSIERLGALSVSDAVRHFTGVTVKDYGGIGGLKTVSLRGFNAQHTAVSYDGITLNDAQAGMIDIGRLSLDNISFISLTHGQSDNIFQPARNFASIGILDIVTETPEFKENRNYQGKIDIKTGSFGFFSPALYYAHKLSNKFAISLNANWQRADGQYPFTIENGVATEKNQKRKNSDINILRSELNLYGKLSDTDNLKVKAYFFNSERGLPGDVKLYNPYAAERLWNKNFFSQIQYDKNFSKKLSYKVSAKYNHDYTKYTDEHEKYQPTGRTKNIYSQNEYYLSNVLLYNFNKGFSVSFSEDLSYVKLRNDSTLTSFLRNPERKMSQTTLSAKYENSRLTLIANLFATFSTDKVKEGESDTYKRITPSISFSYALFKSKELRIRMSYKDIFRVPTITEEYYKWVGNKLKPEKARQLNYGVIWSTRLSDTFDYFNLTIDGYYANIKDKIIMIPSGAFASTSNKGKVRMKGVDINLSTNIIISSDFKLLFTGGYSFLEALDMEESYTNGEPNKSYKNQIPYTPKHSGSASLSLENPWVNFTYSFVTSSHRYISDQNIAIYKISGYADHNISLNKEIAIKEYPIQLQFDLLNILNKNYQIIKYYPMPGRSFRISLGFKF